MRQQPSDLWRGGPWEQPSPALPPPPAAVVPVRPAPAVRRRRRRRWFPFLALFCLIVALSVGTVAARYLLPQPGGQSGWSEPSGTDMLRQEDPFGKLERAETGTGVTVQISQETRAAMTATEIYDKCVSSIVSLQAESGGEMSTGTGILMTEDGYLLTNAHIVSGASRVLVSLYDDRVFAARLVGADQREDLAVLKIEASGLTPAEFGDSSRLRTGDPVVAIGDPMGYRTSITQGIISALDRTVNVDGVAMQLLQTSAPINFGNSGGALINDEGQVVGITTVKLVSSEGSVEGMGFAIPMTNVKLVADWLIAGRPSLGVTVQERDGTLTIVQVEASAAAAGVQAGDRLVSLNGTPITTIQALKQLRSTLQVGDTVTLQLLRDDGPHTVTLTLQPMTEA